MEGSLGFKGEGDGEGEEEGGERGRGGVPLGSLGEFCRRNRVVEFKGRV
jgi:hypothetical protein